MFIRKLPNNSEGTLRRAQKTEVSHLIPFGVLIVISGAPLDSATKFECTGQTNVCGGDDLQRLEEWKQGAMREFQRNHNGNILKIL